MQRVRRRPARKAFPGLGTFPATLGYTRCISRNRPRSSGSGDRLAITTPQPSRMVRRRSASFPPVSPQQRTVRVPPGSPGCLFGTPAPPGLAQIWRWFPVLPGQTSAAFGLRGGSWDWQPQSRPKANTRTSHRQVLPIIFPPAAPVPIRDDGTGRPPVRKAASSQAADFDRFE